MCGGMGPAPKRSPRSCNGLGTLWGEDAPVAHHCSWVLHPQQDPHPTCLLPPHCQWGCPLPKPFLPLFIFLSFIRKAGSDPHNASCTGWGLDGFSREPGSFPHPAAGGGSPWHPPPVGHPSLTSAGRDDEAAPSLDPDPRRVHGAKGLSGEWSRSRSGTQTSSWAGSSKGQVRGEWRDPGHPPIHLPGGHRAPAGPRQRQRGCSAASHLSC